MYSRFNVVASKDNSPVVFGSFPDAKDAILFADIKQSDEESFKFWGALSVIDSQSGLVIYQPLNWGE